MEKDSPAATAEESSLDNPERNPRRAATKLKEMQLNLEMMRNRFKVIEGKEQYSRYRTLDHSKRIDNHLSIHQQIAKEKQLLKKSMDARAEVADIRLRNELQRTDIKKSVNEARQALLNERMQRSLLIADEFAKNEQRIRELKDQDYELNRSKRSFVLEQEEQKRDSLKRHHQHKIKTTLWEKEKATANLNKEASSLHQELLLMAEMEKQLNEKYSRSLQASQTMKNKYNEVLNLPPRSTSEKLPELRTTPGTARHTALSEGL